MNNKITLYRYTATADHEPDNLYQYAQKHGSYEAIWIYNDVFEALRALPDFESTCVKDGDKYAITCYAMEGEG